MLATEPSIAHFRSIFPNFISTELNAAFDILIQGNWQSINGRLGRREDLVMASYYLAMHQFAKTPYGIKFSASTMDADAFLKEAHRLLMLAPQNGLVF